MENEEMNKIQKDFDLGAILNITTGQILQNGYK